MITNNQPLTHQHYYHLLTEKTECHYCGAQQLPDGTWIKKEVQYFPRFPRSKNVNSCPCPECHEKALAEI